jgi:hypothetical protein
MGYHPPALIVVRLHPALRISFGLEAIRLDIARTVGSPDMAAEMIQKTLEVDVKLPRFPMSFHRVCASGSRAGGWAGRVFTLRASRASHRSTC